MASPDDDDVAFEHAHGSGRVPGSLYAAQRRTSRPALGNRSAPASVLTNGVKSAAAMNASNDESL